MDQDHRSRGRPADDLRNPDHVHDHAHDHAGHSHRGRAEVVHDGGDRVRASQRGVRFAPAPEVVPGPATITLSPSLMRMSVWTRLAFAAGAAGVVWAMTLSVVG